jgi:hypothetical protein
MGYAKLLTGTLFCLILSACDDSGVTGPQSRGPTSKVRVLNTVVDTGTVDFVFVDKVENLPTFREVPFRGHSGGSYHAPSAGSRPLRIFPTSTNAALTSTILVETDVNLEPDARYTLVYAGRAGSEEDTFMVLEDPVSLPTPAAGNIAIKALHAAFGTGDVDIYVVPVDSTAASTPADFQTRAVRVLNNVGYLAQTAYVEVPVRPSTGAGRFYRLVVTSPGSPTPLFAATPNLPGSPPPDGVTYGASPGVQIEGSVLTIVVAPGAMPNTRSATTSNQSRTAFFVIDRSLDPQ